MSTQMAGMQDIFLQQPKHSLTSQTHFLNPQLKLLQPLLSEFIHAVSSNCVLLINTAAVNQLHFKLISK